MKKNKITYSENSYQKINLPNNVINVYKDASINYLLYFLFFEIAFILWIICIIIYLNRLKECKCFTEKNIDYSVNIDYLLFIEYVFLIFIIIITISTIGSLIIVKKLKKKGGSKKSIISIFLTLLYYIFIGLFIYFAYNVYKLYKNISVSCDCANNIMKYLLYIQSIFVVILFIFIISANIIYN